MKPGKLALYFSILVMSLMRFEAAAQQMSLEFIEKWDHSEHYLLKFTALMPDSLYDFKPQDDMLTFDEQLFHIINHIQWITHDFLQANESSYSRLSYKKASSYERVAMLRTAFQDVREAVLKLDDTDLQITYFFRPANQELRTLDLLHLMLDHTTHHRGQLVVYLRLCGIKPPQYIGW
jgi:uncharacterized damage-inducible protein DinB